MTDTDFPPHDPDFPDVNPATGDERETEPDQPELSQAEIDCDPNTETDDLNHRYDPVD